MSKGVGAAVGGAAGRPEGAGDAVARQAMELLLARLMGGGPQVGPWSLRPDLSGVDRQVATGSVNFARTPVGPRVQPPMRGRPYTSYNRSRIPTQNTPGVGPMGNLPFQAFIDRAVESMSFPPMYGMPRSPQGGSGPVVGEHFRFLPPTL